jgi:hypothetical protein
LWPLLYASYGCERNADMPYAEVNDIRMYYEEMGSGEPFVLLGNLNQMTSMKRNIPNSELLIINHAWVMGSVVMEFLERWGWRLTAECIHSSTKCGA